MSALRSGFRSKHDADMESVDLEALWVSERLALLVDDFEQYQPARCRDALRGREELAAGLNLISGASADDQFRYILGRNNDWAGRSRELRALFDMDDDSLHFIEYTMETERVCASFGQSPDLPSAMWNESRKDDIKSIVESFRKFNDRAIEDLRARLDMAMKRSGSFVPNIDMKSNWSG